MRVDKPDPTTDPPSPHRQTFPGLSDALDRLAEVAGYHPEFDELRARLDELTTFAPLVRLHARGGLALSAEAVRLLGRQVRPVRKFVGLSRRQLAAMCGVADSTIRNFETGRHRISDSNVAMVLGALLPLAEQRNLADPDLLEALRAAYRAAVAVTHPKDPKKEPQDMSTDDPQDHTKEPSPEPINEAWGRTVQRRREAVGMQQSELATRAGLSFSSLKGIESGGIEPTEGQRRNITEVLADAERLQRPRRKSP